MVIFIILDTMFLVKEYKNPMHRLMVHLSLPLACNVFSAKYTKLLNITHYNIMMDNMVCHLSYAQL